jgi:hypothetical protein
MTLPPEILAFKLLRKANITKEEKQLVLTGMNYENRPTLKMIIEEVFWRRRSPHSYVHHCPIA